MTLHENNNISELPSLILILCKPTNNEYVDKRDFIGPFYCPQRPDNNSDIICCKALRPFLLRGFWKVFKATKLFQNAY